VTRGYDLTAKNPNRKEDYEHRPPEDLVADVLAKEQRILEILDEMQTLLGGNNGK
jgi:type I restriction enzyme M protein